MNVRGLIPSLGAGGSLIAAALCALAVFGGVLAFRGEGPGTAQANAGDLAFPAGAVRGRTGSSSRLADVIALARRAVRAPRAVAAPRRPPRRVPTRHRIAAPPRPRATTPVATTPAPGPAGGGATRPAVVKTPATPAPPPVVKPPGTVQNVVAETRSAVQPVVDAAPAPVQAPADAVGDTGEQVAATVDETVDETVGGLLP
jgi:hypothetical protein